MLGQYAQEVYRAHIRWDRESINMNKEISHPTHSSWGSVRLILMAQKSGKFDWNWFQSHAEYFNRIIVTWVELNADRR